MRSAETLGRIVCVGQETRRHTSPCGDSSVVEHAVCHNTRGQHEYVGLVRSAKTLVPLGARRALSLPRGGAIRVPFSAALGRCTRVGQEPRRYTSSCVQLLHSSVEVRHVVCHSCHTCQHAVHHREFFLQCTVKQNGHRMHGILPNNARFWVVEFVCFSMEW